MYDFYEINYSSLFGCIYCRPWPWEILTKVSGIRIINSENAHESRKKEIEEFFLKKGVKAVVWR